MKVGIKSKRLWGDFSKFTLVFIPVLSIILPFIDFNCIPRVAIIISIFVLLFGALFVLLIFANRMDNRRLKINGTDVNIVFGDIFSQTGWKVIAFNEYFDTNVDNKIISEASLNGVYIKKHPRGAEQGAEYIDAQINANQRIKEKIVSSNEVRKYGGKSIRYKLGTICPVDEYLLLAFTHFDENNRAVLSVEEYFTSLLHMWDELDVCYAGKPLAIPLLGSGITRFNGDLLRPQEHLKYILMTFAASKITFKSPSSLTIVLPERARDEINIYEINTDY